ncbi:sensor histidine kinase [Olivibacter sp. CPCC 100613]|uniref:sensor histidine kinase n=1 Tax=Olivibacter sp. CPCC 100613 TaxID=3079931 RepID=UPI002FF6032B
MILVFDNVPEHSNSLMKFLKANNLLNQHVTSPNEIIKHIVNFKYKLLILRTESLEIETNEILDAINNIPEGKELPVLLISSRSKPLWPEFEKYTGLYLDYLIGNYSTTSLLFKIKSIIDKQRHFTRLQIENNALKEELEKRKMTGAAKDEFISIAGHELSTPITSINAYLQLALRSANNKDIEQTIQLLSKGLNQTNKLNRLAKDLLDSSRLQTGKMEYNFVVFNCRDYLKQTIESVKHSYPDRQINVYDHTKVWLEGDHERLEQVLSNYLTNALKYSPEDTEVLVYTEIIDNKWLKVCVKDQGQGIPREKQPYIFHKYYRVNNKKNRHQGLGMGLFICAQIITHHNGKFGLESEPGKGSVFYFILPIKTTKEKLAQPTVSFLKRNAFSPSSLK